MQGLGIGDHTYGKQLPVTRQAHKPVTLGRHTHIHTH